MERGMAATNQKTSLMAEVLSPNVEDRTKRGAESVANRPSSLSRSLHFKYYIHDSVSTLRFQLIGDLRAANVLELNGSWDTARTTLAGRRFLLDLNQLYSTDDDGQAWLSKMRHAGAEFLPADYMESASSRAARRIPEQTAEVNLSLLGRVMGLLRGER
jgi:hypothetical protein